MKTHSLYARDFNLLKLENTSSNKFAAVDAARGWAILLVMLVHSISIVPELPYPARKIAVFGWYGVQLFFIASAFTLLNSWYKDARPFKDKIPHFFLRRFFRIVPMYYTGVVIYYLIRPPQNGFNFEQLIISLAFINAWSPVWMPTIEDGWSVVPGGWSISVEFCFYFCFPFLAVFAISIKRSLFFFIATFLLMVISYNLGSAYYSPIFSTQATELFLFFWLPNQLCIFAIGFIAFSTFNSVDHFSIIVLDFLKKNNQLVMMISLSFLFILTQTGVNKHFSSKFPWIPTHLVVSVLFGSILVTVLASTRHFYTLVNPWICRLGTVSFSAYVLHWAVIDFIEKQLNIANFSPKNWVAIGTFLLLSLLVIFATFLVSYLTYRFIEYPFIRLSHGFTQSRNIQVPTR